MFTKFIIASIIRE